MTYKPPHQINSLDPREAPSVNQNFTRAYSTRLESINKRDGTATAQFLYQSVEYGEVLFSATGSATVAITYNLAEKQNKIIYAGAHSTVVGINAHVTDITSTALTITIASISATSVSSVTNDQIKIFYQVVGSNP
jgi:hypothetical protein